MKNWKLILLVAGILLLIAAFAVYAARIVSCYPSANILAQYSPEYVKGFRESCQLDSPLTTQFSDFLTLFIPGIILFSAYWLMTRPRIKDRRVGQLSVFLLLVMFDSLLVMLFGLLGYPAPGIASAPTAWVVEVIAALGSCVIWLPWHSGNGSAGDWHFSRVLRSHWPSSSCWAVGR